ncbi:hypothetical protein VTN77DRAFT_3220 [Rasamsonia byssochlamydoides]|uniref:uncharacterized protein n=1 Tax=Rasamsonia byssochlamydoides TaxID=89139 RepID=UPI003743602C
MKTTFVTQILWLAAVMLPPSLCSVIQGISAPLLSRLTQMATICMSTYLGDLCVLPDGMSKVSDITNSTTDIHGWILRDDGAREILAVFRGTESVQNYETDTNYTLAPFDTFPECVGCEVHGGYYLAWVSIVDQVTSLLQEQAAQYPDHGVVFTGHRYLPHRTVECTYCTYS